MAGQIGYKSQFFRGATQIGYCRKIDLPVPSRAKIDTTHLESPGFTHEFAAGFIDLPEMTVECIAVVGNTAQENLEADFLAGVSTPEAFSVLVKDPDTGVTNYTYSFTGYISSCVRGPIETEALILLSIKIQLTAAPSRS